MKSLVRSFWGLAVVATLGLLVGCGGGSNSTPSGLTISVSLTASSQSINAGGTSTITAVVSNDSSNQGVNWTLSGVGTLSGSTTTSVVYNAPTSVTTTQVVSVTATSIASSAATASIQITVSPSGTSSNVQPISVDGGPVPIYPNGVFTSVQVCAPGTTTCTTVDGILVDTGSYGLRVLSGALSTIGLQPITSNGQTLNNCVAFADGSFLWGQVELADVYLSGEIASSVPVQVIADPTGFSIPSTCDQGGTDEDNQTALGANGILGVGPEPNDCTLAGVNYCDNSSPVPVYYACASGSTCTVASVPLNDQVTNPIVAFPVDNNGVILNFPAVSGAQPSVSGTMTFGVGTQSNNGLGSQTVYTMDTTDGDVIRTTYAGLFLPYSFIDSGSNAYFIPNPTAEITVCTDFTSFFCPSSLLNETATNAGATQGSGNVPFQIDNTDNLFATNGGADAAYGDLGGPNGTATCTNTGTGYTGSCSFDWGLPFFFGKTVYVTIDGQGVPTGQPAAPWWAY